MNEPTTPRSTGPQSRRRTVIGVTAGLLAGGTIGLLATAPSLVGAASDETGASTDSVVALQETDTDTTTDTTSDVVTDERPEPGDRLREALQPLVDDGTIDAAQADAVAAHLVENRPDRDGHRGHRRARLHVGVVAEVIGIDAETLRTELAAGKSISDVAEENGVATQTVIDALVADVQSHIDLAIEHGLDEERAAERLAEATARIEELVEKTREIDG